MRASRWRRLLRVARERTARVRSHVDFELYRARDRAGYYLGLVALLGGAASLRWPVVAPAVGLAGGLLSVVTVWWDRRAQREAREKLHLRDVPLGPISRVGLPRGSAAVVTAAGTAVVWPDVDAALRSGRAPGIVWSDRRYSLPPVLAEVAFHGLLPEFRSSRQPRFNGSCVRQAEDLVSPTDEHWPAVGLGRATYFDLLCSNYSARFDVLTNHDVVLLEGRSLVVDRCGALRPLEENRLANIVGVSTLAVTSDGAVVVVAQGRGAASSPGLAAPSGSGTLEPLDIPRRGVVPGDHPTLRSAVVTGMERELREEVNLEAAQISRTVVTGYFRWWEQGAKPEYVGVSLLTVDAAAVLELKQRASERPYVRQVRVLRRPELDLSSVGSEVQRSEAILAEALSGLGYRPSLPLVMAVRGLAEVLAAPASQPGGAELLELLVPGRV